MAKFGGYGASLDVRKAARAGVSVEHKQSGACHHECAHASIMNLLRKSLAVESGSAVVVWGHFILRVSAELTSFHIRVDLGSFAIGRQMQQFPGGPWPTLNLIKLS